MADPRLAMGYEGVTDELPVVFDSSINAPTLGIAGLSVSSSLGLLVTDVSISSYGSPQASNSAYNIVAGLGSAGSKILGQIIRVEPVGASGGPITGTVKIRGIVIARVNASSPPTVFNTAACDGTGFAQAGNANTDKVTCLGYQFNPNNVLQPHLQGTITQPTSTVVGPESAILNLGQ